MHAKSIALVMLAACGYPPLESTSTNSGPDGGNDGSDGGTVGPDGGTVGTDGGGTVGSDGGTVGNGCQAPTSYGAATVSQQSGEYFPPSTYSGEIDYKGALNATDVLTLWLFDADPPFAGTFHTGTFQLSGQTNLATCGSCVIIATGCNNCDVWTGEGVGSWYIANAGTLTLTTLTSTNIAGTLANATLVHVNINVATGATTAAADGCTTHVTSASFSSPLTQH